MHINIESWRVGIRKNNRGNVLVTDFCQSTTISLRPTWQGGQKVIICDKKVVCGQIFSQKWLLLANKRGECGDPIERRRKSLYGGHGAVSSKRI